MLIRELQFAYIACQTYWQKCQKLNQKSRSSVSAGIAPWSEWINLTGRWRYGYLVEINHGADIHQTEQEFKFPPPRFYRRGKSEENKKRFNQFLFSENQFWYTSVTTTRFRKYADNHGSVRATRNKKALHRICESASLPPIVPEPTT